ncbi:SAM-dependent methyltransferase [Corynebacterium phoceense]|uniref:THUMP-like domain-containing protein n=1 Tax=Corynebacterium phoceense TaxID=1686286 RepID=UPI00211CDC0C|nr:SAM-dependent methyltransferase [Corynebacterium phoceense]MCQ9335406.1 SAM-dependent methyltransferase [Corynebacterium phoceense]
MSFTLDEVAFLAAHTFDHDLELTAKTQLKDVEFLRGLYGEHARAVAELLQARRSGKLPAHWLADATSVQQATPPAVASFRAQHLAALGVEFVHDVTCSIGTEGALLRNARIDYAGSDLDAPRLAMARHNVPDGWFVRADALVPVSNSGVIVADPARRAGGRRITDPAKLLPPLPDLVAAYSGRPLAIKCAPGLDFSEWDGGVDIVSVDGGVKEACLYTPDLAAARRRAVVLRDGHTDIVTDAPVDPPAPGEPGRFILEPDGAIIRAGLVQHYAAREGLWQLDEHLAYLTGDRLPAGTSGFEFIEQVPLKKLKAALAAHDCGRAEILVRGVNVDPDQLRKKLKLRGPAALTVVVARVDGGLAGSAAGSSRQVAFICGPRVSSSEV